MADIQNKTILGNMLYNEKKIFIEHYGETEYERILSCIKDSEASSILKGALISQNYYPLKAHVGFLRAVEKEYGRENLKNIIEKLAEAQVSGLYGLLIKFISFATVAMKANKMWKKQFETGNIKVNISDTKIIIHLKNYETEEIHAFAACVWMKRFIEIIEKTTIRKYFFKFIDKSSIDFIYEME
ncbi:MAG: hypothetical protein ACOCQX_00355 [Candidatus Nanoarchaeia archaeon]